jgi:hypothetical protein
LLLALGGTVVARRRLRMTLEGWLNSLYGIPRHRAQVPVLHQGQERSDLAWELNWARDGFCQVLAAWPWLRRGSIHTTGLIGSG